MRYSKSLLLVTCLFVSCPSVKAVSPAGQIYQGRFDATLDEDSERRSACVKFGNRNVFVKAKGIYPRFTLVGGWEPFKLKKGFWIGNAKFQLFGAEVVVPLIGRNPAKRAIGTKLNGGNVTSFIVNSSNTRISLLKVTFRGEKVAKCTI